MIKLLKLPTVLKTNYNNYLLTVRRTSKNIHSSSKNIHPSQQAKILNCSSTQYLSKMLTCTFVFV